MVLDNKESNSIITTIHRYKKFYVNKDILPDLYCSKNDGTHLPLISRMDNSDNVYLYCLSCDYEKQAGFVTRDFLNSLMKQADSVDEVEEL
jgi:hypothetical protein